jgi:hypothetical protein
MTLDTPLRTPTANLCQTLCLSLRAGKLEHAFCVSKRTMKAGQSFLLAICSLGSPILSLAWTHSPPRRTAPHLSRREVFQGGSSAAAVVAAFGILVSVPSASLAASGSSAAVPTKEDLDRIKVGYQQITYLLDNFEKETTVCRENGGECKRNADPIRRALGLRTINVSVASPSCARMFRHWHRRPTKIVASRSANVPVFETDRIRCSRLTRFSPR